MCLGVLCRGINDVSRWFQSILGPLDPNLGLRTPVESYMRATEVAFKVGDEAIFPTSTRAQRMPSRPTSSLLGLGLALALGLGLGSPSWFTKSVLQHLFKSQGRENILAASSKQASKQEASKQLSSFLPIRISPSA